MEIRVIMMMLKFKTYFKSLLCNLSINRKVIFQIIWFYSIIFFFTYIIIIYTTILLVVYFIPMYKLSSIQILFIKCLVMIFFNLLTYFMFRNINSKNPYFKQYFSKIMLKARCLLLCTSIILGCIFIYIIDDINVFTWFSITILIQYTIFSLYIYCKMGNKPSIYYFIFILFLVFMFTIVIDNDKLLYIIHSFVIQYSIFYMNPYEDIGLGSSKGGEGNSLEESVLGSGKRALSRETSPEGNYAKRPRTNELMRQFSPSQRPRSPRIAEAFSMVAPDALPTVIQSESNLDLESYPRGRVTNRSRSSSLVDNYQEIISISSRSSSLVSNTRELPSATTMVDSGQQVALRTVTPLISRQQIALPVLEPVIRQQVAPPVLGPVVRQQIALPRPEFRPELLSMPLPAIRPELTLPVPVPVIRPELTLPVPVPVIRQQVALPVPGPAIIQQVAPPVPGPVFRPVTMNAGINAVPQYVRASVAIHYHELQNIRDMGVIPCLFTTYNPNFQGTIIPYQSANRSYFNNNEVVQGVCIMFPSFFIIGPEVIYNNILGHNLPNNFAVIISFANYKQYVYGNTLYKSNLLMDLTRFTNNTFEGRAGTAERPTFFNKSREHHLILNYFFSSALEKYNLDHGLPLTSTAIPVDWGITFNRLDRNEKIAAHFSRLIVSDQAHLPADLSVQNRFLDNNNYPISLTGLRGLRGSNRPYPYHSINESWYCDLLQEEWVRWDSLNIHQKMERRMRAIYDWRHEPDGVIEPELLVALKKIFSGYYCTNTNLIHLLPAGVANQTPPNCMTASLSKLPLLRPSWEQLLRHHRFF